MVKKTIADKIQEIRKELTNLIHLKIIPLRNKLDELLDKEAQRLCPFEIGDIITLVNGKKGKIMEIKYHSLNYEFYEDEEDEFHTNFYNKNDVLDYEYAYVVDNKSFSITWIIYGFRMIKKDTVVGKIRFTGITPVDFIIHEKEKRIENKPLNEYMSFDEISNFDDI